MSGWQKVAKTDEFVEADRKLIDVGEGRQIGLFKVGGEYYAVDAWCSHQRASLMPGEVEGYEIVCPVHGARFDLRTGRHLSLPAVRPIRRYNLRVVGTDIEIEL